MHAFCMFYLYVWLGNAVDAAIPVERRYRRYFSG